MKWSFAVASENLKSARDDWDALNRRRHNHILLDSGFVLPLVRYFAPPEVLLGTSTNSVRPGMALIYSRKFGSWETFQPGQAPLGLFVAASPGDPGGYLSEILNGLPRSAMQVAILQQDPDFSIFSRDLAGPSVEVLDYIQTARTQINGKEFENFWATRGDDLRKNLMRRMRRLEKNGERLELLTIREPGAVAEAIRIYGQMEARSWKGREGTAITEDNDQALFYREIMEHFCARGEGLIYQLCLNGKVIGSEIYLERNGMLVGLKTTFDEDSREISPGFLMKYLIMRQVFAEGQVQVIEFYGRATDWHTKWATHIRTMYHVNYFRNRWVLKGREILKRLKGRSSPREVA